MASIRQWLDPAFRFERSYAENSAARFRSLVWPGGAHIPQDALVPTRGLDAAFAGADRVVITGAAGMGKTSALARLAWRHAQGLLLGDASTRIPIYVMASDSSGALPSPSDFPHALNLNASLAAQCPRGWFSKVLASGRGLLLVDDMDAFTEEERNSWLAQYPNAQVVATGNRPLSGFSEFPLPSFGDTDILAFARNQDSARAGAFVNALKTNRVPRSLSSNPFTLTLLWQVWQKEPSLPTLRVSLLDAYVRQSLGEFDESVQMLEGMALACMRGTPVANGALAKGHGFLRASGNHSVEFTHKLWQAYFAARALRRTPLPLDRWMHDRRWQEVAVFYAGMGDAGDLVRELMTRGDWILAGRAITQAREVSGDMRDAIVKELVRRAWEGDRAAADALSDLDEPAAIDELAAHLQDADSTVRGRKVQVLGQLRSDRALDYLLPLLGDPDAGVRTRVVEALGGSLNSRVVDPLLVILRGEGRAGRGDARARAAAARALGRVGADKAVPALVVELQTGEPEVRAAAAQALKDIPSALRVKPLKGILESGDDPAREYAAEILAICET